MKRIIIYLIVVSLIILTLSVIAAAQDHPILRFGASFETPNSFTDETVIHFIEGATMGLDQYDAEKMMNQGDTAANLYSYSFDEDPVLLVINGLPISAIAMNEITIPLGLNVNADGTWKIELMELTDVPQEINIFLIDSLMDTKQDMSLNPDYIFEFTADDDPDRFYIKLQRNTTVDIGNEHESGNTVYIYSGNGKVFINSSELINKARVRIFNSGGQLVTDKIIDNLISGMLNVDHAPGIYIIQLINNKEVISRKLYIN